MPLLYEKRGQVAVLTFSRPEVRNAWCEEFYEELRLRLEEAEADRDVRCAVLTGDPAGGAFSAGADLKNPKTHTLNSSAEFIYNLPKRKHHAFRVLDDFAKPLVCAVNGYAIGIGCIVTYSCDLIVASDRAEWRLPQVRLGILPAQGALVRLARWVGKGHAMRLGMGFPLKADEALRIGLAQWVVPHEDVMKKAMEVAEHICAHPPLSARMTRESLNQGLNMPHLTDAALLDQYRFLALEGTEDKKESHRAWREKRTPRFKGE
ncbi:MAG TPA: enoyl-CoA hydratase/isomerase family protein [Burkholderiales bacterium]|nr:enoyl-CoA hydratase/isomerase family protein [Burkholderiales bacterium]